MDEQILIIKRLTDAGWEEIPVNQVREGDTIELYVDGDPEGGTFLASADAACDENGEWKLSLHQLPFEI